MVISESQQVVGNLQGIPNLYRALFFVSLILLVLVPLGILGLDICLESRNRPLDGNLAAVEAELASLNQAVAADNKEITTLDNEVTATGRAEQLFAKGPEGIDPNNLWRTDSRWSDMGKARVLELWGRRAILLKRAGDLQSLVREKTAEAARTRAAKDRNAYLQKAIRGRALLLKILIAAGVVGAAISALAWSVLIQSRVNIVLGRWASRR
jgi:hypothetical protein